MKLGEKLRYLREVEGSLRGKERAMTQQELVRAIKAELKASMSQSVPVANRKRSAAAPDQHHAAVAGEVLQGASGLPGR